MNTLAATHVLPPYAAAPRPSLSAVLPIAAAHAGVLALLASTQVLPLPATERTLTVDLLTPAAAQPEAVPPKPQSRPPQPQPKQVSKPVPRRTTAAQPAPQPTPVARVADTAAEVPVVEEAPAAAAPAPAPATRPAPPAPVTVSQPSFDVDYLTNPAPVYPLISRRMGEEGRVVLRVRVEADGRPSQVELKTASGSPRLDRAAEEAVRRWRFVPARRGEAPVAAWVLVPIAFNLNN